MRKWSIDDSAELYNINGWGLNYFSINEKGHVTVTPKVGGVGGGTCAAFFRRSGVPAVVWCQEADCAHMPNEYAVIEHIINESKIFALMMCGK